MASTNKPHQVGKYLTKVFLLVCNLILAIITLVISLNVHYSTCPALAKPGVGISQKLLDGAVPQRIELQKHPLQKEVRMLKIHIRVQ